MNKNKSGIIHLLPLLLIGLVIAGGAYYFFKNSDTLITPQSSPTPESMLEVDTSDWETYVNSVYGYSLKYKDDSEYTHYKFSDDVVEVSSVGGIDLLIEAFSVDNDPIDWWESQSRESVSGKPVDCFDIEKISAINGFNNTNKVIATFNNAIKVTNTNDGECNTEAAPDGDSIIVKNGSVILKIYHASLIGEQILSTFEFTE